MNVLHPSCARSPRWSPPVLRRRFEDGLARLILDGRNSRVVQFYTPGPVASWSTERRNSGCHSFIHSYSFISTTVDKTQLCHRDGDRTEKEVNVTYINNQILELEQLHNTTTTCKTRGKVLS